MTKIIFIVLGKYCFNLYLNEFEIDSRDNIRFFKLYQDEIYFSTSYSIYVCDHKGKQLNIFGEFGELEGQLRNANGITVDSKSIYICDTTNHRLQVWLRENGKFLQAWGGSKWNPQQIFFIKRK